MPYAIVFMILLSAFIVAGIEIPRLVKDKKWKELLIFFIILGYGLTNGMLIGLGYVFSTHLEVISKLVGTVKEMLFQ
ncbi:MAG: hypothetical protein AB1420_02505 [Bacillota bacterium]